MIKPYMIKPYIIKPYMIEPYLIKPYMIKPYMIKPYMPEQALFAAASEIKGEQCKLVGGESLEGVKQPEVYAGAHRNSYKHSGGAERKPA